MSLCKALVALITLLLLGFLLRTSRLIKGVKVDFAYHFGFGFELRLAQCEHFRLVVLWSLFYLSYRFRLNVLNRFWLCLGFFSFLDLFLFLLGGFCLFLGWFRLSLCLFLCSFFYLWLFGFRSLFRFSGRRFLLSLFLGFGCYGLSGVEVNLAHHLQLLARNDCCNLLDALFLALTLIRECTRFLLLQLVGAELLYKHFIDIISDSGIDALIHFDAFFTQEVFQGLSSHIQLFDYFRNLNWHILFL